MGGNSFTPALRQQSLLRLEWYTFKPSQANCVHDPTRRKGLHAEVEAAMGGCNWPTR